MITVLTLNTAGRISRKLMNTLSQSKPPLIDICCFQEGRKLWPLPLSTYWMAPPVYYEVHHRMHRQNLLLSWWLSILSLFPVINTFETILLEPKNEWRRTALGALIATPTSPILVATTHLGLSNHEPQVSRLLEWVERIAPKYVIITGDFNFQPSNPAYNLLCSAGYSTMLVGPTFRVPNPTKQIDYIFVRNLTIHKMQTLNLGEKVSDHAGVLAWVDFE